MKLSCCSLEVDREYFHCPRCGVARVRFFAQETWLALQAGARVYRLEQCADGAASYMLQFPAGGDVYAVPALRERLPRIMEALQRDQIRTDEATGVHVISFR